MLDIDFGTYPCERLCRRPCRLPWKSVAACWLVADEGHVGEPAIAAALGGATCRGVVAHGMAAG